MSHSIHRAGPTGWQCSCGVARRTLTRWGCERQMWRHARLIFKSPNLQNRSQ